MYRFALVGTDNRRGLLTLDKHAGMAEKTGNTKTTNLGVDTMTGNKNVKQYYDEFVSLEKDYDLVGDADHPKWVNRKE
jgi:hypothetical protein